MRIGSGSRLAGAAALLVVLMLGAKLASVAKEMLVAAQFGLSASLDAFLLAFAISTFFTSTVGGALNVALQPVIARLQGEGYQRTGAGLLTASMAIAAGLGLGLSCLAAALVPVLLQAFGGDVQSALLTQRLLLVLLPSTMLQSTAMVLAAPLNLAGRGAAVQFGALVGGLSVTAVLWSLGKAYGILGLALAHVAGFAVEVAVLLLLARGQWSLAWDDLSRCGGQLRALMKTTWPIAVGALLTTGTSLLDSLLASTQVAGSVSALTYAARVVSVLLVLGHGLVHALAFPTLSKLAASGAHEGLRSYVRRWQWGVLAATIPVAALFTLATPTLVRALYQRGSFGAQDTAAVSVLQVIQLLQLPFNISNFLAARLLAALEQSRTLLLVAGLALVVKSFTSVVLMRKFGVEGIAAASVLTFAASAAVHTWLAFAWLRRGTHV